MGYVTCNPPIRTGAMSSYPYSESLERLYTFQSAFDETVCGAIRQGKTLLVPRESVPYAPPGSDFRTASAPVPILCAFTPRNAEQQKLYDQSLALLKTGRNHIFEAPTGWGKTVVGGAIAAGLGQPTLIVVTKEDLMHQWYDSLTQVLHIPPSMVGKIQADVCDWQGKQFVLGMVQCVDPMLRILTADMRYVPAVWIKAGDELVGFDEHPVNHVRRSFQRAKVLGVARRQSERVRISFDSGQQVIVSHTHSWLTRCARDYSEVKWKYSCDLKVGDQIPRVAPTWFARTDFEAGWMSGIADGEACITTRTYGCDLSFAQKEGPVWDEIRRLLTKGGYEYRERRRDTSDYPSVFGDEHMQLKITRMADVMRFLGEFQPVRLRSKDFWSGRRLTRLSQVGVAVVKRIEPLDSGEVVSIQTSTHTFVAEGLASHNSLIIEDKYPPEMFRYFGLLMLDEVHHMAAECFVQSCQLFSAKYRLGFSATPTRRDGKTQLLHWHVGPILVKGQILESRPKVLVRHTGWCIPTRSTRRGNGWEQVPIPYAPGRMMLVTKAMASSDGRNMEIVNFVVQSYASGRLTLILSELREHHLNRLFQMLTNEGVPGQDIGYYVGGMSKTELSHTKQRRVVLGTYAMCSTGTDVPKWDTLVMATPRADVKQAIGRVLRSVEGKKQPVIFDLVDRDAIFQGFHRARLKQYYAIMAKVVKV